MAANTESDPSNEPTPEAVEAWRALVTAHAALIARVGEGMRDAGVIGLDWYDVLFTLYQAPGRRLRLSELADRVLLSRSGLTRLVDRLGAEGLLRREACETDRRGAFAALTEHGLEALRRAWPVYRRGIGRHFAAHLSPTEVAALTVALTRLHTAAQGGEVVPLTVRGRGAGARGVGNKTKGKTKGAGRQGGGEWATAGRRRPWPGG